MKISLFCTPEYCYHPFPFAAGFFISDFFLTSMTGLLFKVSPLVNHFTDPLWQNQLTSCGTIWVTVAHYLNPDIICWQGKTVPLSLPCVARRCCPHQILLLSRPVLHHPGGISPIEWGLFPVIFVLLVNVYPPTSAQQALGTCWWCLYICGFRLPLVLAFSLPYSLQTTTITKEPTEPSWTSLLQNSQSLYHENVLLIISSSRTFFLF